MQGGEFKHHTSSNLSTPAGDYQGWQERWPGRYAMGHPCHPCVQRMRHWYRWPSQWCWVTKSEEKTSWYGECRMIERNAYHIHIVIWTSSRDVVLLRTKPLKHFDRARYLQASAQATARRKHVLGQPLGEIRCKSPWNPFSWMGFVEFKKELRDKTWIKWYESKLWYTFDVYIKWYYLYIIV